tara:strand:- start:5983 stop:7023 length:1041 start_codon:yes stop_codon:yes gene_type:complete
MTTHLKIKWPNHYIVVELCKTPVVEKWKLCIEDVIKNNAPPMITFGAPFYHAYGWQDEALQAKAVKEINSAIEDVNKLVPVPFPYHAYEDMPWEQTNWIHRCFTTAQVGHRCWQLGLTATLKRQCKNVPDGNMRDWIQSIAPFHFDTTKVWEPFSSANSRINKWTHIYEDQRRSQRAINFKDFAIEKYGKDIKCINLELDVFLPDGQKWYTFQERSSIDDIKASFPDNKEECNVTLMKSITGKDYFQCYQEYDDPAEWDIQNVGVIKGGMSYYPRNELNNILNGSDFEAWYKSYGLTPEQVEPVPLGKIVEDTVDYDNFDVHETDLNSDGTQAICDEYKNLKYELI